MLGVVAHRHGALGDLTLGGGEGLTHFAGQEFGDDRDLALEQFGRANHQMRPVRYGGRAPRLEGRGRVGEGPLDVLIAVGVKFSDELFGGGINCGE